MEPFATVADYEARYGEAEDEATLDALLMDATVYIASQPGLRLLGPGEPGHDLQRLNLTRVTCGVVRRVLNVGDLAGFSQYTQSAVNYAVTVSPTNGDADFYLSSADRRSLGIGVGRVGQTSPYGR